MMEIELPPPAKQSQQDMDLIDILWKQDIDLGVGREVFDYNQRQKEYELEKQKKLEKEHQEQLLKEQEKAFYAHLQLDEETGEFIPVQQPPPMEAAVVVTQANTSSFQNKQEMVPGLSFDECIKILSDTFQFEAPAMTYQIAMAPSAPVEISQIFFPAEQLPAGDTLQTTATNADAMQQVEQAWEELLSLPELQCLGNQIDSFADLSMYSSPEQMAETAHNYIFPTPLPVMEKPVENTAPMFSNDFAGSFAPSVPTANANPTFNVESFCDDIFTLIDPKVTNVPSTDNSGQSLTELLNESADITDLSMCKAFNGNNPSDYNDSDSGISVNTSPCATSPGQSMGSSIYGDTPCGYSDSEIEDMDNTTETVQQHPTENVPMSFTEDAFFSLSPFVPLDASFETEPQSPSPKELPARPSPSKSPFMKDKSISRLEARFTRDEQKAKALNLPFTVDKIVNLPVDDFNVLMSKHQFNDAQLALVRDIRRRGKNKVAAQNCRKRKMENIVELETDLDKLKYEKEKLLAEKGEYNQNLRLLKEQLGSLYMDIFSKLRDEDGKPYSHQEYSLQHTKDGSIFLVPKAKKIEIKKERI
ncbi:nuclear factor erythroid 2-related factor 2 [Hyperolius riggenbachi]|uniref:nuclear factor erythroid 2-related factor 2 n=1 Tax=Hyperolius riggenbachi TaxID=752182 RepID=UPI0035A313DF